MSTIEAPQPAARSFRELTTYAPESGPALAGPNLILTTEVPRREKSAADVGVREDFHLSEAVGDDVTPLFETMVA